MAQGYEHGPIFLVLKDTSILMKQTRTQEGKSQYKHTHSVTFMYFLSFLISELLCNKCSIQQDS